jgi:ketosteroid isomerase-like protein
MTTRLTQTREVLERYLDALVTADMDRITDSFTVDATWSLPGTFPLSGVRRGRDAIVDFLVNARELFAPGTQEFTFGEITAESDRAVLEWQVRGTAAATGKAYDNHYCGVFVIREGRIVEVREYFDSQHAAETLFASAC